MNNLEIMFNDQIVLTFDRNKPIPHSQQTTLKNMELRMNEGIQLGTEFIEKPKLTQKTQYAANSMIFGLLEEDYNQAMAMCTYLGTRLPDLNQIKCIGNKEQGIKIEFVVDNTSRRKKELRQNNTEVQESTESTIKFFDPKDFMKN